MPSRDPRVDAYIGKSPEFAKPILNYLRETVHAAAPDIEETVKWSAPFFLHNGRILCHMAAFKQHCAFGFWKTTSVLKDRKKDDSAGQFGRILTVNDLPPTGTLVRYLKKAMKPNAARAIAPVTAKSTAKKKPDIPMPETLASALRKNRKAKTAFDALSPSHRREYSEWIAAGKADATRARRVATTIEWLCEGKSLHWKYQRT